MKTFLIEVDGVETKVLAEKIGGQLWFHFNGETKVFTPERKGRSRSGSQANIHPGEIYAPMPGKIIKVMAQAGTSVTQGQAVIIMEAMKMEYTLEADVSGTVENIGASEGDQVSAGQCLVKIKSEDNNGE